jgi:hypothetical protein
MHRIAVLRISKGGRTVNVAGKLVVFRFRFAWPSRLRPAVSRSTATACARCSIERTGKVIPTTGRKIHRQEVNRLADLLLPTTERLADIAGCHLILVTIPDRLGKSSEDLSTIASVLESAAQQKGSASDSLAHVEYTYDDIAAWPQPRRDPEATSFFERRFGFRNANLLFHGKPDFSVVAVMIRSARADKVVDAIASAAKEAADQCSGTRPALIAVHMIDEISRPELQAMLTKPNGFHAVADSFFRGGKRQHVDAIAFTVPQSIRPDGTGAKRLSGDLVLFNNPQPLFSADEIRSVFRSP